jgi:glycosyltransferase involved in cell wall biosynthesis
VRILYLNSGAKLGGAETSLRELLAAVRSAQPSWELSLVLGEDGPLSRIARELGVQVFVQPFPPRLARVGDAGRLTTLLALSGAAGPALTFARSLRSFIRKLDPDVVHTNGLKMHLFGALCVPRKTPLVWHIHDYVGARRLMSRLLRVLRHRCDVAIVNSISVAADLKRVLPGLRTVPIYNAVDLQRFSPDGGQIDLDAAGGAAPPPAGTIRVGLIATFARWKGHKVFLEALAQVPSAVPIRGYVIGGPIYQTDGSQFSLDELKQEAERLQVSERVVFTGFLEDAPAAMRSLDVVVHASTQPEPFGMVIIEAMACGKAVIASRGGGASEIFSDGENALAHSPGDASGLARQLVKLAQDPRLRCRLGEAGRQTAEKLYFGKRLADEVLAVYHAALGKPPASGSHAVAEPSLSAVGDSK